MYLWFDECQWFVYFGGIPRFGVVCVSKRIIVRGISLLFVFEITTIRHRRVSLHWRLVLWILRNRTSIDSVSLIRMLLLLLLYIFTCFESHHWLLLEVFCHVWMLREIRLLFWLFYCCFRRSSCRRTWLWFIATSCCCCCTFCRQCIARISKFHGVNRIAMPDTRIEILRIHVV